MKKIKFITCIYSDLYGTEFGGRPSRYLHYRWSLLSLLKMTNADFVCYTSEKEYDSLVAFFYDENNVDKKQLIIKKFELNGSYFHDIIIKYQNIDDVKKSDRCISIQYMKFIWLLLEDESYEYYYWIDAGLSHCGLIPDKFLEKTGHNMSQYYLSSLFNNNFLDNLINVTTDKILLVSKENAKYYWSGTVNPTHFANYDSSRHIIGGLFGGKSVLLGNFVDLFKKYVYQVTTIDGRLYHEEDIMTLIYRNHPDMFTTLDFDIWWHENVKISGIDDMNEYIKDKKSFYKILENLQ